MTAADVGNLVGQALAEASVLVGQALANLNDEDVGNRYGSAASSILLCSAADADSVNRSGRQGLLATDNALALHGLVRSELGKEFWSFQTLGDGGCGIHAGWGLPNIDGMLEYPGGQQAGRRKMSECLQHIAAEDLESSTCTHLDHVRSSLWSELTMPAATSMQAASVESRIMWTCMRQQHPALSRRVEQFILEAAHHSAEREVARSNYQRACNRIFKANFEAAVIRPLATLLHHPEFPVDNTAGARYASLFHDHGVDQYDRRRQSFLEYWGMGPNRELLMVTLRRYAEDFAVGTEEYRLLAAWIDAYDAVSRASQDAPDNFVASAWETYTRAILDDRYYFSTSEILLFARITEKNVVVSTHNQHRFSIVGSAMCDRTSDDVIYISLEDRGRGPVRGHFERMWSAGTVRQTQNELLRRRREAEAARHLAELHQQQVAFDIQRREAEGEKQREAKERERMSAE